MTIFINYGCQEYEARSMVPDPTNTEIAGYTTDELLSAVPETFGLKMFVQRIIICLLDDIVRVSIMLVNPISHLDHGVSMLKNAPRQPEQPWYLHALVKSVISGLVCVHRWLLLPWLSPSFPIDIRLHFSVDASCPRLYPNM